MTTVAPLPIAGKYHQLLNIKLKIHKSYQMKNLKLKKRTSMGIEDYRRMIPTQKWELTLALLKILSQIPQMEFLMKITS